MTIQNGITNVATGSKSKRTSTTYGPVKRPSVAKAIANTFAIELVPVLQELNRDGIVAPSTIAEALNKRGVPTARGGKWAITTVTNLISRLALIGVDMANVATKQAA